MTLSSMISSPENQGSLKRFINEQELTPGGSMRQAVWFEPSPPYAAFGSGCYVVDVDGRRFTDFGNNFFSLVHGHAFAPVVEEIIKTARTGTAFGLPTDHEVTLARLIQDRIPSVQHVRFCNSGSEAVMFAIKAARALTERPKIAKFEGAYHGSYDYAEVSLATQPGDWTSPFPISKRYSIGTPLSVSADVVVLPWNDIEVCEALITEYGPSLAAILIDLLPSRVGMIPPIDGFVERLTAAARNVGALIVADEVVSLRLSYEGASSIFGLDPDIVALGKVIGGGLPVGAVGGNADAMRVFDHVHGSPAVAHGGTFSANPLTMVAGAACLSNLGPAEIERINTMGSHLRDSLNAHFQTQGLDAQVTGYGSLFRLHLTRSPIFNFRDAYADSANAAALKAIHAAMVKSHILLTPNCSGALSTVMDENNIDILVDSLSAAVKSHWRHA